MSSGLYCKNKACSGTKSFSHPKLWLLFIAGFRINLRNRFFFPSLDLILWASSAPLPWPRSLKFNSLSSTLTSLRSTLSKFSDISVSEFSLEESEVYFVLWGCELSPLFILELLSLISNPSSSSRVNVTFTSWEFTPSFLSDTISTLAYLSEITPSSLTVAETVKSFSDLGHAGNFPVEYLSLDSFPSTSSGDNALTTFVISVNSLETGFTTSPPFSSYCFNIGEEGSSNCTPCNE